MLASCSTDMNIKLWNMQTFTVQKTLTGHEHEVSGLAWIPQHQDFLLSCGREPSIRVWDTISGTCIVAITQGLQDWIKRVAVSSSGNLFCSASDQIIVWSTEQVLARGSDTTQAIQVTLDEHEHQVDCIAWASEASARTIE